MYKLYNIKEYLDGKYEPTKEINIIKDILKVSLENNLIFNKSSNIEKLLDNYCDQIMFSIVDLFYLYNELNLNIEATDFVNFYSNYKEFEDNMLSIDKNINKEIKNMPVCLNQTLTVDIIKAIKNIDYNNKFNDEFLLKLVFSSNKLSYSFELKAIYNYLYVYGKNIKITTSVANKIENALMDPDYTNYDVLEDILFSFYLNESNDFDIANENISELIEYIIKLISTKRFNKSTFSKLYIKYEVMIKIIDNLNKLKGKLNCNDELEKVIKKCNTFLLEKNL